MRILFTRQQPLTAPGGETSHLFAIAREMQKMGNEVIMMPVTGSPTPASLWPPAFTCDISPFGLHHLFDSFSFARVIPTFAEKYSIDVVIGWQYETAWLPHLPDVIHAVVAAAPFGLLKRNSRKNPARALAYHFFHFRQLRRADVIYCPSYFAKNELVQYIGIDPQRIIVTHLSADPIFQPAAIPNTGPLRKFIFSGSLEPIKGIFDAIAALGIVYRNGYTDWTLDIAGWGDEPAVFAAARDRGIAANIRFLGRLDRADLSKALSSADLAILPSHTDNFGLSIAEAESSGLPVVSYRVGGIPEEVIEGETAILVTPFDHAALSDAIITLIQNPQLARDMGLRGARHIREMFSWQKTAQKMLDDLSQRMNQA